MKIALILVVLLSCYTPLFCFFGKKKDPSFPKSDGMEDIINRVGKKAEAHATGTTPPATPASTTPTTPEKDRPLKKQRIEDNEEHASTTAVTQISRVQAAMAILNHIFTLQSKQSGFPQNTRPETLTDATSRSSATYTINHMEPFTISATIAPTNKGLFLARVWASNDLADQPFQTLHKAFHDASAWKIPSTIHLGAFFTCTRPSPYKEIACTSKPALTKELFMHLKAMHAIQQKSISSEKK